MGPFEYLWLTLFIIFICIAFVRKYPKELGTTTLIFVALFLITYVGMPKLPKLLNDLSSQFLETPLSQRDMQHLLATIFSLTFVGIVFSSYAGQTFSFKGKPVGGARGFIYNLLVGVMNGYLIAGTLWFFQDYYQYPITDFHLLYLPLTSAGEQIANFLPPYVVPPAYWAILVAIMLLFRVRK